MAVRAAVPTGTVTFLFTDMEGSTRLLHAVGESRYGYLLAQHNAILRHVWQAHGGVCFGTEGDAFHVAFADARAAVTAAGAAQEALAAHDWPADAPVRVRMGLHTGTARVRDNDYWGMDVHYAARLCTAAHGGQVLLSDTTAAAAGMPAEAQDVGEHGVRDFPEPRRLFHVAAGGRRAEEFPPLRTRVARSTLPTPPGPLIGRDEEVAQLHGLLTGPHAGVITIIGPGGSGKTRLAMAAAAAADAAFDGEVCFAPFGAVSTPAEAAAMLAAALESPQEDIVDRLRERRLLLLLDNLEHVLGIAPLVAEIGASAPGVRILATSQAPLRIAAERLLLLAPLKLPPGGEQETEVIAAAGSVMLFAERARARDPGFRLDPTNAAAVAELCRRLDGLPLAIELAASRVRLLDPRQMLDRLSDGGLDVLGRGGVDLPERHRGLRATLAWTLALVSADARRLFARLGVFAGPWPLELSEEICGDGIDVLDASAELVEFSLLRRRGDGRLEMPAGLRPFAREALRASGQEDLWRRRHVEALISEAEELHDLHFLDEAAARPRAAALHEELLAALRWAREHDRLLHARLAGPGVTMAFAESRHGELVEDGSLAARCSDAPDGVRSLVAHGSALLAAYRADWPAAIAAADSAVELSDAAGDALLRRFLARMCAGWMRMLAGDERSSLEVFDRIVTDLGPELDQAMRAFVRGSRVHAMVSAGMAEGEPLLEEMMRAPTPDFAARSAQVVWAEAALRYRDHQGAWRRARSALSRGHDRMAPVSVLFLLETAAGGLAALGRLEEAVELAATTRNQRDRLGMEEMNDGWRDLVYGEMERATRAVPADALAPARERGRGRDLPAAVAWLLSRD